MTRRRAAAALAMSVLAFAACSSEKDGLPSDPAAQQAPSPSSTLEGGTADHPVELQPTRSLLEWVDAPSAVENTVTTNGTWFLTVEASGEGYRLDGPDRSFGTGSNDGTRITNALLDSSWAVVVRQDQGGGRPATAEVTDLAQGKQFTIDADSDPPTVSGGTWALGGDSLVHSTDGPDGRQCVATVDLTSRTARLGWCAAAKHGFNSAHVTSAGTTVLTFDDAKPRCRTVGTIDHSELTPLPGVAPCKAWEGAMLAEDAAVWSVIPEEDDIEAAEFLARDGKDYYALGPGTSGTLVPCGDAAYFVRDPQREGKPAQLMRWDGRSLEVVYEAPAGPSFLDAPRCGDRALVVTAHSERGDQQVMAALSP